MDPMLFILIVAVTVLLVGGVWGSVILSGLMKRRTMKLESRGADPRIDELQEGQRLLEARLEQLEEEVSFFRELRGPESPPRLSSPDGESS